MLLDLMLVHWNMLPGYDAILKAMSAAQDLMSRLSL